MKPTPKIIDDCRGQFPALLRRIDGQPAVYFDGPAGTQVPRSVVDAMTHCLVHTNANRGGQFATSRESDEMLVQAHAALAAFLGTDDPGTVSFGPNMTTLTFALSRALAKTWQAADEVIVTRLDHDANITPWVRAARESGAVVKFVGIRNDDCTLDLDDFRAKLTNKTRLVAVGCASNSVGTINPVRDICSWAKEVGALVFLDAVHYAPHAVLNVQAWGCDFLACSAYKFFGPHVGILWGRRELLEELDAYKVRPAPDSLPGKWMTGTQNHEGIAGTMAAVEYLADIGRVVADNGQLDPRAALAAAFEAIGHYERDLFRGLLHGLMRIRNVAVWGIADPTRTQERLPTVSITHNRLTAGQLACELGRRGIFVWHGNFYAQQLTETLGLEPEGMLRIGLVHYNTALEVERLLSVLRQLS